MQKSYLYLIPVFTILLSSCFSGKTEYTGLSFPATSKSTVTFQEHAIPADCSAFSHLLMNTAMNSSGQDIANSIQQEAQEKGADLILIGMARAIPGAELESNLFDYYGPDYPYVFNKTWLGWKFGFDEWNDAGGFTSLGTNNWGNPDVDFADTLIIQAVFLHCGKEL